VSSSSCRRARAEHRAGVTATRVTTSTGARADDDLLAARDRVDERVVEHDQTDIALDALGGEQRRALVPRASGTTDSFGTRHERSHTQT
jgi:hypothetical protein